MALSLSLSLSLAGTASKHLPGTATEVRRATKVVGHGSPATRASPGARATGPVRFRERGGRAPEPQLQARASRRIASHVHSDPRLLLHPTQATLAGRRC
jgi:hypothetical protein